MSYARVPNLGRRTPDCARHQMPDRSVDSAESRPGGWGGQKAELPEQLVLEQSDALKVVHNTGTFEILIRSCLPTYLPSSLWATTSSCPMGLLGPRTSGRADSRSVSIGPQGGKRWKC